MFRALGDPAKFAQHGFSERERPSRPQIEGQSLCGASPQADGSHGFWLCEKLWLTPEWPGRSGAQCCHFERQGARWKLFTFDGLCPALPRPADAGLYTNRAGRLLLRDIPTAKPDCASPCHSAGRGRRFPTYRGRVFRAGEWGRC